TCARSVSRRTEHVAATKAARHSQSKFERTRAPRRRQLYCRRPQRGVDSGVGETLAAGFLPAPERRALAGARAGKTGVQTHVGFAEKSVWWAVTALALSAGKCLVRVLPGADLTSDREIDLPACPQFVGQQAVIDKLIGRRRHGDLVPETHDGSIPVFQFA